MSRDRWWISNEDLRFFLQKVGWTKTVPTNNSRNFIQPSMRWLSHQLYPEGAGDLGKWFKFFANLGPQENVKKHVLEVFGEVGGSRPMQHMHLNSRSKSKCYMILRMCIDKWSWRIWYMIYVSHYQWQTRQAQSNEIGVVFRWFETCTKVTWLICVSWHLVCIQPKQRKQTYELRNSDVSNWIMHVLQSTQAFKHSTKLIFMTLKNLLAKTYLNNNTKHYIEVCMVLWCYTSLI